MKSIKLLLIAALSITFFTASSQDTKRIKTAPKKIETKAIYSCPTYASEMNYKPEKYAK